MAMIDEEVDEALGFAWVLSGSAVELFLLAISRQPVALAFRNSPNAKLMSGS